MKHLLFTLLFLILNPFNLFSMKQPELNPTPLFGASSMMNTIKTMKEKELCFHCSRKIENYENYLSFYLIENSDKLVFNYYHDLENQMNRIKTESEPLDKTPVGIQIRVHQTCQEACKENLKKRSCRSLCVCIGASVCCVYLLLFSFGVVLASVASGEPK